MKSYQVGELQVVSEVGVYCEGLTECCQQTGVGVKPDIELVV